MTPRPQHRWEAEAGGLRGAWGYAVASGTQPDPLLCRRGVDASGCREARQLETRSQLPRAARWKGRRLTQSTKTS